MPESRKPGHPMTSVTFMPLKNQVNNIRAVQSLGSVDNIPDNPTNDAGQMGLLPSSIVCAQNDSTTQGAAVESSDPS